MIRLRVRIGKRKLSCDFTSGQHLCVMNKDQASTAGYEAGRAHLHQNCNGSWRHTGRWCSGPPTLTGTKAVYPRYATTTWSITRWTYRHPLIASLHTPLTNFSIFSIFPNFRYLWLTRPKVPWLKYPEMMVMMGLFRLSNLHWRHAPFI